MLYQCLVGGVGWCGLLGPGSGCPEWAVWRAPCEELATEPLLGPLLSGCWVVPKARPLGNTLPPSCPPLPLRPRPHRC